MKGSHQIIVETEHMKYDFTIRRNITIILGDSGTGKTTLVDYLNMYSRRGTASGVIVQSDVPCVVFSDISGMWKNLLGQIQHSIVFIDEGQPFIFSSEFAKLVRGSDNYYVLITRRPIHNLPYSTKEIYGIRTTGKYHFPEKVYQEFYPVYDTEAVCSANKNALLVLEDSNAGYEFFKKAFPNINCISCGGNSRIADFLCKYKKENSTIVFADSAAFGAYIDNILSIREYKKDISLYLPESFEWLILRSGIVNKTKINDILAQPENYIDSSLYFSWERYFTDLLEKETADDRIMRYRKDRLSDYYISGRSIQKILDVMPEEIRNLLNLPLSEY